MAKPLDNEEQLEQATDKIRSIVKELSALKYAMPGAEQPLEEWLEEWLDTEQNSYQKLIDESLQLLYLSLNKVMLAQHLVKYQSHPSK